MLSASSSPGEGAVSAPLEYTIQRMHNLHYQVDISSPERSTWRVKVRDTREGVTPDVRFQLVQALVEKVYSQQHHTQPAAAKKLLWRDRSWNVQLKSAQGWSLYLLSYLTTFIHTPGDDGIVRLRIVPNQKIFNIVPEPQPLQSISLDDVSWNQVDHPCFSDPFTQLATLAFQRYETDYQGRDHFSSEESDCCIVLSSENCLELIRGRDVPHEAIIGAVKLYRQYLLHEVGEDRLFYFAHLMQLDLQSLGQEGHPLTPEVVYRMNIAMGNVETAELKGLLQRIHDDLIGVEPGVAVRPLVEHLEELHIRMKIPRMYLRRLYRYLAEANNSAPILDGFAEGIDGHFVCWARPLRGVHGHKVSVDSWHLPAIAISLLACVQLDGSERQRMLTGRQIVGMIGSAYTIAQRGTYKPWVDMQELHQVLPILMQCSNTRQGRLIAVENWVHTVCKKHLLREHPYERYRVGAILPAPGITDDPQAWYRVYSCCDNGYGGFCYTLLPLIAETTLPVVRLFRSTASDRYALRGGKSKVNGLNDLNSPGYLGKGLADPYDRQFYDRYTIPLWMGYMLRAQQILDEVEDRPLKEGVVHELLVQATELYREHFHRDVRRRFLVDLIREYDWLLSEIQTSDELCSIADGEVKGSFCQLYGRLRDRYIRDGYEGDGVVADAKVLAEALVHIVQRACERESIAIGIKNLHIQLHQHVLSDGYREPLQQRTEQFGRVVDLQLESIHRDVMPEDLLEGFRQWIQLLQTRAEEEGEGLQHKEARHIIFAGHSLGGAVAQVELCHHLVDAGRMVMPGCQFQLYAADSPAINAYDAEKWRQYIHNHADLFNAQRCSYEIILRFEAADLFALIGQRHIGSARSIRDSDADHDLPCYHVDAVVRRKEPSAKHVSIRDASTAHATRFEQARKISLSSDGEGDYHEQRLSSYDVCLLDAPSAPQEIDARKRWQRVHYELFKFSSRIDLGRWLNGFRTWGRVQQIKKKSTGSGRQPAGGCADQMGVIYVDEKGVRSAGLRRRK